MSKKPNGEQKVVGAGIVLFRVTLVNTKAHAVRPEGVIQRPSASS